MQISKQWHKHLVSIGSIGGKAATHNPLPPAIIESLQKERKKAYLYARQLVPGTEVSWEISGKKYSGIVISRKYTNVIVRYTDSDDTVMVRAKLLRKKDINEQKCID